MVAIYKEKLKNLTFKSKILQVGTLDPDKTFTVIRLEI